ncbi:MAG: pyridoxamine 5'-phosphate oxidase family protein, partial [Bacteroidota bacterium]
MHSSPGKALFYNAKDDPDQIRQAMQREFRRAVKDKKHPFRLAVLGSQKSEGIGLRYVVLREYTEDDRMLFYTDSRSPKVHELQEAATSSLLFYHPQKGVQIRIEGKMEVHYKDVLCKEHWQRVQGIVQRAYTPLIPPGEIIEVPEQAHQWPDE